MKDIPRRVHHLLARQGMPYNDGKLKELKWHAFDCNMAFWCRSDLSNKHMRWMGTALQAWLHSAVVESLSLELQDKDLFALKFIVSKII
jgi:hypothetical protein